MGGNGNRIVITGVGLVTSLGLDAQSSVAAIRSGIANFTQHETVLVNGDRYGTRLRGASVARIPDCFTGRKIPDADRAAALLAPAIRDCIDGVPHEILKSAEWRVPTGPVFTQASMYDLLQKSGSPVPGPTVTPVEATISELGRCTFFQSIALAAEDLLKGKLSVVIIVCVDSLCDDRTLQSLCDRGRLKSGTNPEGIVAGEAAAVVMLESESHALSRNGDILAYVSGSGKAMESRSPTGKETATAVGLRKAFAEAFASLNGKGEEIDMVIADLNGERARAKEWAYTEPRIFPRGDKVRELVHPADCTGDCGTAMGGVLLATALDHLPGASSGYVALATSDKCGARTVLCLHRYQPKTRSNGRPRKTVPVFPRVLEQQLDDASFLWGIRNKLVESSQTRFQDLVRHDRRLHANLLGIRHAGDTGWEMAKATLPAGDAGDLFTAAFAALSAFSPARVDYLLEKASERKFCKAAASAVGWLPYEVAEPHIKSLLSSECWWHRYIGITACAIHRRDPGDPLDKAACDPSVPLRGRAIRAYGELRRGEKLDLLTLRRSMLDHDDEVRFWASWSGTLAGNQEAVEMLKGFVRPLFPAAERALMTVVCRIDMSASTRWLHELAQQPDTLRFAVAGIGMTGNPADVPWLLEKLENPALARIAGEAFSMITGVDITVAEMEASRPERFSEGPYDDPGDSNVAPAPDEELPWPDREAVTAWWDLNKGSYAVGVRHLAGKPVTENHLRNVLCIGTMKDRARAALLLALMAPEKNFVEVRAPVY